MRVLKKIGSFFAALVPFFVLLGAQVIIMFLCLLGVAAVELMKTGRIIEALTPNCEIIMTMMMHFICLAAAYFEFKVHRFHLNDISPVKQNVKVYIPAVFLAAGAFFVFRFFSSVFYKVTGLTYTVPSASIANSFIVLIIIVVLEETVLEEFVLRGLLIKTFEMRFPVWVGIIVSILAYVPCRSSYTMFYSLLFGAMLVLIRWKFGDIKLCMLVHFIMGILDRIIPVTDDSTYETVINVGSAAGVVIAAAAMFLMLKFASGSEQASDISK